MNAAKTDGAAWANWALWSALTALGLAILRWSTTPGGHCRAESTTFDMVFLAGTPALVVLSLILLWPMRRHRGNLTAAFLAFTDVFVFLGALAAVVGPCMS